MCSIGLSPEHEMTSQKNRQLKTQEVTSRKIITMGQSFTIFEALNLNDFSFALM